MKRIKQMISKIARRPKPEKLESRITNETVAEHREQILAGGRRFKYPVQYSRHKLVLNSILIGLAALIIVAVVLWWQLYIAQNSSKFMYRMAQIIPVPVASVDGELVKYSTYLKRFRSSIHYLQQQNNLNVRSEDGKKEVEYRKRVELDNAVRDAYVRKLANENKIRVTVKEVNDFIKRDLESKKVSETVYEKTVLNTFYDWSMDDYREVVRSELLQRKVMFAIDESARAKANRVLGELRKENADFAAIAKTESDDESTKQSGGDSGDVPLRSLDTNGVIAAVKRLEPGQTTDLIYGTDGYYVAKLTSKNATSVRYQFVKISLSEFEKRLKAIREDNKVKEFIDVKEL